MFLQASVILLTGGVPDQVHPPGTRYIPLLDQVQPLHQVPPLGPGTPPGTRYTPQDQVHPLVPGTHTPQTRYTPRPGTPPSWTRYPPWDQVHPPTRYTPRDQVHPQTSTPPWDQVHPPGPGNPLGPGTPPGTRYPPRTREIRSMRGRYASYWNAFLFFCVFSCLIHFGETKTKLNSTY